ncbi:MAG: CDP-glycerol glycerophosphotransferase family protein [Emcibacter sp.]|nr:CDP-glycerol glycerophosphotransferase family protein [Emcibacter sp.]
MNKSVIQQLFMKYIRILCNKSRLRKKRTVVFSAPTDFHFQHLLPIIREVEKYLQLSLIVVEAPDWDKRPELKDVEFISADDFHKARWRLFDLIVATEFSAIPWWFKSGLRLASFHGAGPKMGYLDRLAENYFDVVFAPGPLTLRIQEAIIKNSAGKNTNLLPVGLPAIDKLYHKAQTEEKPVCPKPVVLYAPSWHIDPSLVAMDEPFLKALSDLEDYHVIIRPHPNLLLPERCGGMDWEEVMRPYEGEDFEISLEGSIYDQLHRADAIISDYSSVLYEYLVFDRPGFLYVSEALLRENIYNDAIAPLLVTFDMIAAPQSLSAVLDKGMAETANKSEDRKDLLNNSFYNVGSATQKACDEIIHLMRL